MKKSIEYLLLACCVAVLGAYAHMAEAEAAKTPESIEKAKIQTGLNKIGIGEGYEIVVADGCDMVENTAAQMMQQFLAKASLSAAIVTESQATADNRIILGQESNLKAIKALGDKGDINIRSVSPEKDGFHLKKIGRDIVVAGANPRGVLYGVYAFEDFIQQGQKGKLDIQKVPQFTSRIESLCTYIMASHPAAYRDDIERTVKYLSRLGANGLLDGGGGSWELTRFVTSDIFPFIQAPSSDLQNRVSKISALCKKYGIDYYIMLWEPTLARVGAELDKYPPEALGKVKRPWGGDENNLDTTLCASSPIVQEHFKNIMKKFVQGYPDVKGVLFYNLDGNSWLCTPELCPRCKTICTDSPPNTAHPWETQALFTDLLAKAAHDERNGFMFIHWISHFHGAAAEKLIQNSKEYSALAYGVQNGDHDAMIPDAIKPEDSEFAMLQQACTEKSVPFFAIYSANGHEVIPNGFPFPFHVSRTLKKLNEWGVRSCMGTGPIPYFNQVNALAEKELRWNPARNEEALITELSVQQFGKKSGKLMYQAWEEIKDGMDVWNDLRVNPFCGSQTHVGIGFSYFTNTFAILPKSADDFEHSLTILTNVEPHRAPDYQKYREQVFLDKFELMGTHLSKAAALAKQAVEKADPNEPIGIHYYELESIPTMKQYAELNYAPIAIADTYCQLRCNMLRAYHLLQDMKTEKAAGNDTASQEKEKQYHELIREDIAVRQHYITLLNAFAEMRPCLFRTSLPEDGIKEQITFMNTEIGKMESFLSEIKE